MAVVIGRQRICPQQAQRESRAEPQVRGSANQLASHPHNIHGTHLPEFADAHRKQRAWSNKYKYELHRAADFNKNGVHTGQGLVATVQ